MVAECYAQTAQSDIQTELQCRHRAAHRSRKNPGVSPFPVSAARKLAFMKKLRDGTTIEAPIEARQAERGPTILNVLLASGGLAIIALTAVYVFFFKV